MNEKEIKRIVEALLFASPEPLTQKKINNIFDPLTSNLKKITADLNEQYHKGNHAFHIRKVAGGYQLVSNKEFEPYIFKMLKKSYAMTLSRASMDCLAIIAYKQPIGRYEIEAIRGVDSSGVIKTLLKKNMIKIKGRDSGPGRPLLYKTTNSFMEHLGINRLSDLPKLKEITEIISSDHSLGKQIAVFEDNLNHNDLNDITMNEKK